MQHQHEFSLFDAIRRNLSNKLDKQEAFDTFATTGDLMYTKIKISETEREAREELNEKTRILENDIRNLDIRLTDSDGEIRKYIDRVYSHVKSKDENITDYINGVYDHVKSQDEDITKFINDVYEHVKKQDIDIVSTIENLSNRLEGEITDLKETDANIRQTTDANITELQRKDSIIVNKLRELDATDTTIKADIAALQIKDTEHETELSTINNTLNGVKNKQEERFELYNVNESGVETTANITTDLNIDGTITSTNVAIDNETRIQQLEKFKADIYNLIYPIGSIYVSMEPTNPGTLFVGTWTRITDRFLWCTSGNNSKEMGGSKKISIDQLPPHSHDITNLVVRGNENGTNEYTIATYGGTNLVITTTNTGGGKDYMQPYITVYAWYRTK